MSPFSTQISLRISSLTEEDRSLLERSLVASLDLRLMPLLILFFILNFLDRQNIASARLANIERDLSLVGTQYQTCVSILFVGYIIMQVPSNLILGQIKRPGWYLCGCMAAWGTISACTGAVQNFHGLLVCRFLLGFFESAFFPGAIVKLALRTACVFSPIYNTILSDQLGNAFGGLIAIGILNLDGHLGIAGWRWLFLIEGSATVIVAGLGALVLPGLPSSDTHLTPEERDLAVWRLREDFGDAHFTPSTSRLDGFRLAVWDPKTWFLCAILFFTFVAAAVTNFFPSVVNTLGYSRNITLLLTAPPYLLCCAVLPYYHPIIDHGGANILAATTTAIAARYVAMMLMPSSFYSASTVTLAWISQIINQPPMKRAAAIALINAISNTSNIWTSYLYIGPPRYLLALSVNGIAATIAMMAAVGLRRYLAHEDKRIAL
ncbi:hypothetical protein BS47DRAFT_1374381 [Hydnum rufescens UP504]|uniref:Major facilitator superfamily (MFS) profile domain-containing protein n=1 Tax=Hydnum rufescens UP504 TaxID=1448309 RepID=A0A9P6AFB4_9AGAM|nr:hypothetical protein BS47DRAFT_1374381 [Hydnum rufescens UP504]